MAQILLKTNLLQDSIEAKPISGPVPHPRHAQSVRRLPGPSNKDRGSRDLLRIHGRNFGHQPDRGGPPEGPEPGQARQGEVQAGFVLLVRSLLYLNISCWVS